VWHEHGKQTELDLWFEIVAPKAQFTANGLFEDAR
jgi:hypothetical protein